MTHKADWPADATVLVTGGGGFIGGALVSRLRDLGQRHIRSVDIKPTAGWYRCFDDVENRVIDLRSAEGCRAACAGTAIVFNLACDMGGIGFIETNKAECMVSVLINTNMLLAARAAGVARYFYSSSACVYAADKQQTAGASLKESDAYPAMPEDGYGWEKLFGERICRHFHEDYGVPTRVGRYHNVFGPHTSYDGGREKAPAALSRKVAMAKLTGRHDIEIWGDGEQTRSFLFIDDCLDATLKLTASDVAEPLNIGSARLISINGLVGLLEDIAGIKLNRRYDRSAPRGVRGRSSDNTLIRNTLGWEPQVPLEAGLETTYRWIYDQLVRSR
jgi:nucleoside-diphosphate-sugar epimerase